MRRILTGIGLLVVAGSASAQPAAKPAQIIVNKALAGINIDIFMDAGKVQTVPVSQQGTAAFALDFLSPAMPQGQLYVEVCKDGQRLRVISAGANIPEDQGCSRKPVGVPFTFTCTRKITVNFAEARASFAGCGSILTNKYAWTGVGVGLTGLLVGVGGDSSSPPAATTNLPPSVTSPTPTTVTSQNTSTQPTPPAIDFTTAFTSGAWDHATGVSGQSDACGRFTTSPAQANAAFTVVTTGPGVLQQTIGAITSAAGVGVFRVRINLIGTYNFAISVSSQGTTRTLSGSVLVTTATNSCPSS